MRVAQNLELIQLYSTVNQTILDDVPNQSELFIRTTRCLHLIIETLDLIEMKLTFNHVWFPANNFVSFWSFFNRFNLETSNKEEATNVKKFFLRYNAPLVPQT